MVDLHFQNYLNKDSIDRIRDKHGFRDSLPLEKFIMDFEVLTHIQEVLPDCVVKGGMAVPFHLHDKTLRRLSVDIDIVTGSSRDEVIEAMKRVSQKLNGAVNVGEPHIPSNTKNKELPLLTYFCKYQSSVDDDPEMKIEIFHDNEMIIKSKKIETEIEVIGFSIDFPLSIYDHGSLIGDKLTTLPFNTIGIDPDRELDVPKQIYDIATLLKSIPDDPPIATIIDTFEKISEEELSYFTENPPTFEDVLDDLNNFSDTLLITKNQIKLNSSYQGRLEKFTTELLGDMRYQGYVHVTDIMLINTIIKLILKKFNGVQLELITEKTKQVLTELNNFSTMKPQDKLTEFKKLVGKHGKTSDVGKIMKDLFPEQVYLYDQLIEIEKM